MKKAVQNSGEDTLWQSGGEMSELDATESLPIPPSSSPSPLKGGFRSQTLPAKWSSSGPGSWPVRVFSVELRDKRWV